MKIQTKAVIASVVVLAMLLSTVGSVTYSWFADEHSVDVDTGTAALNVSYYMYDESSVMNALTLYSGAQTVKFTLRIVNDSPINVDVTASLEVQRYYAVEKTESGAGTGYESGVKMELQRDDEGNYSKSNVTIYSGHDVGSIWSSSTVTYGSGSPVNITAGQSPVVGETTIEGTTYGVRHTTYSAASTQMSLSAGTSQEINVKIETDTSFVTADDLFHFVLRAAQGDIVGQVSQFEMKTGENGSQTDTVQSSEFGDAGILEFTDGASKVRIGKQAFSGLSQITVSWTDTADPSNSSLITRTVTVSGVSNAGWIQYEMVCDGPVWKVASGDGSSEALVPASISYSDTNQKTTVSFSDSSTIEKHTVVYQKASA